MVCDFSHIDDKEEKILEDIAAWMEVNGEGIFDTRPWCIYGEGPSIYRKVLCHYQAIGFNRFKLRPLITLVPHPYHGVLNDILGFCPIQGYSERQSKEFILQRQNIVSEADLLHLYNNDGLGYEKLQTPITFF